jgi:pSer/pThr/pTyr-binding forkhead associated (FHA) protein
MYKLVISDDEGKTTSVPLVREEITIGRKEGNTIRLTDRNVSRRHAKLQKQDGAYVLQDLGSYNGTVINGTRLSDTRSLKTGDQIVIGDYKLNIVDEGAALIAPSQTASTTASAAVSYQAPASAGGNNPQATVPAIPSALSVPPAIVVPEHVRTLQLRFTAPAGTPAPFTLNKLPVLLGRSEIADVSLPFSSISREHARITLDGDQLVIEDMGSSNGITVNGERVKKKSIGAGDAITMGVVEFRVAREGEPAVAVPPAASAASVASAGVAAEPVAAEPKKSNAGMLVGAGVLLAVLGGGGVIVATRGGASTAANGNSTVVAANDPPPSPTVAPAVPVPAVPAPTVAAPTNGAPMPEPQGPAETAPPSTEPATAAVTPETPPPSADNPPGRNVETPPTAQPAAIAPARTTRPRAPTVASAREPSAPSNPTTSPAPRAPVAQSSTPSPSTQASGQTPAQCLLNNDFQCVVNLLRGRASSEIEFNQLVEAYKGLRNNSQAERTMRQYLERYEEGRYAERYRARLGL